MRKPARPADESVAPVDASVAPVDAPLTRWFIALRPEVAARRQLQGLAQQLVARRGGRFVPAERVHLTLAFVGNAPRALAPALRDLVAGLPAAGPLVLDRLGSFDGRLLWLGPATTPAWLDEAAQACRDGLDRLEVAYDRKPFAAHLTLVRNARPTRGEVLADLARTVTPIDAGASTLHAVESTHEAHGLTYRFV